MVEACWNCKKSVTTPEEASIPVVVKLGVTTTMFLVGRWMMYPRHVCKRCRASTGLIGALGLTMVGALLVYLVYLGIRRVMT